MVLKFFQGNFIFLSFFSSEHETQASKEKNMVKYIDRAMQLNELSTRESCLYECLKNLNFFEKIHFIFSVLFERFSDYF